MASAIITDVKTGYLGSVESKSYPNTSVTGEAHSAKITDIIHDAKITSTSYPLTKIIDVVYSAKVIDVIPFYVRFTNIGIAGYGPGNPAPIGIAIVGGLFTSAAHAAENTIADTVNSTIANVQMGLLGLLLLGGALNPKGTIMLFARMIMGAVNLTIKLGAKLLSVATEFGFVGRAVVGSKPVGIIGKQLRELGGLVLNWAISLGSMVVSILPAAFSTAFTAIGLSARALQASMGFIAVALVALTSVVLIFGDSLGDFIGDLVFKFTGIGNQARKTKKEVQDLLTVDKVGELDIVLKSKLDNINFNVLSEKELGSLKRELTKSNSIFEKNQSIYAEEGDLTRSQIKETNTALEQSNTLLDRIARKGEKSFAGGILSTVSTNVNIEGLQ